VSVRVAAAATVALALSACSKIDYLPPDPVAPWPTRVLMHRGGGSSSPYPENTLPAVRWGASILDGVEIDLELSANGTLWLGHDNEVLGCDGNSIGCFQDLEDASIDAVAYCDDLSTGAPVQHYVRLDEVFARISVEFPDSLFALDIKGQYCRSLGRDEARAMADEVDRLVRTHAMDGKVAVETEQRAFLERTVENATPVYSFVNSLGDIDAPLSQAANLGATGISFKYAPTSEPLDASVVAGIHRVGHRIIVWTINTPEEIAAVWATHPDVIETDNADFKSHVTP
jgi:glycerophosphoryl diester phosphodiesterase